MERINVKIIIDKQTDKFVEVTIDKNATLRDLLSEASKSENMKDISYFKLAIPGVDLIGPESLDKTIKELGFTDKSCECQISPYTLDNNKKDEDKDKWEGWIDLKSISSSSNENNKDGEKNDSDTITLTICDNGKEVTRLNVTKNTTMQEIKNAVQKKYDLIDEQINELHLCYNSGNIFYDLHATVEQVFDKKDIENKTLKTCSNGFDFNLKTSENEASNEEFEIFLYVYDSSGNEHEHMVAVKKNITVIDLINDTWKIFKGFSEGFIIVVNSEEITGESNLEKQLTKLELGSSITVYLAGSATCKGKSLIKIEDLKSDLNKNNNENYVSKTDPANKNNWPFSRIIVGIIDLLLLAAAITTFLLYFLTALGFSIAVPIVLTVLFVIDTVLFLVWDYISPESWRKPPKNIKTEFNTEESSEFKQYRGSEITKNDLETEKKNPTEIIYRSNK